MYDGDVRPLGLTNSYVSGILKKHTDYFTGINKLSPRLHNESRFSTVTNIDGHFITIIGFPEKILFIDSFGLPPQDERILNFLDSDERPCFINEITYQHPLSVFCGYFTMYFILYTERQHHNLRDFEPVRVELNDQICIDNLCILVTNDRI